MLYWQQSQAQRSANRLAGTALRLAGKSWSERDVVWRKEQLVSGCWFSGLTVENRRHRFSSKRELVSVLTDSFTNKAGCEAFRSQSKQWITINS